jgi:hypothetical protein
LWDVCDAASVQPTRASGGAGPWPQLAELTAWTQPNRDVPRFFGRILGGNKGLFGLTETITADAGHLARDTLREAQTQSTLPVGSQ